MEWARWGCRMRKMFEIEQMPLGKMECASKIEMCGNGRDGLEKMRDARCKSADGMRARDKMEKWGYRWKPLDGSWCHPSTMNHVRN